MCDNGGEPLNVMKHPPLAPKVMFVLKLIMSSFSVAIFSAPRVRSLERLREKTSHNSRLLQFLRIISCTNFFCRMIIKLALLLHVNHLQKKLSL